MHLNRNVALFLVLIFIAFWPRPAFAQVGADKSEEIVYIDNSQGTRGALRVLDPIQSTGVLRVEWKSVESDFTAFALGDVNNDGDSEVIGIRGGAGDGQIVVYDPVVKSGAFDGVFNSVPWRKLATIAVAGEPSLVAVGNFDPGVTGDELLVGYALANGANKFRIDVYKGTAQGHDGTNWVKHIADRDFPTVWRDVAIGDVIAGGAPEVLLLDPSAGLMRLYRPDAGFIGSCEYQRSDAPVNDAVVAQWTAGGNAEIVLVRNFPADGTGQFARVLVFGCLSGSLEEVASEKIVPSPFALWAGDVNANGDDEVFMVREESTTISPTHLLGRAGEGNDMTPFATKLDADNGYRTGAAGDVDGDGKDEVVLVRDNRIRVYYSSEIDGSARYFYIAYTLNTNKTAVEVGNLDKNGFVLPALTYQLSHPIFPKTADGKTAALYLVNRGQQAAICSYTFFTQSGVQVGTTTPCTIPTAGQITIAPSNPILPAGNYHLLVSASQPVESIVKVIHDATGGIGFYSGVAAESSQHYVAPLFGTQTIAGQPHSRLTLAATGAASATVSFFNLAGSSLHQINLTLPTNGATTLDLANIAELPVNFRGLARISVTGGRVNSLASHLDSRGGAIYQDRLLPALGVISSDGGPAIGSPQGFVPRVLKRVATGQPTRTTQIFVGSNDLADTISLDFRDSSGGLQASSSTQSIVVNGGMLYDPSTLAALPDGATTAIISGTVAPLVSEVTLPDQADNFAADGYAAVANAAAMSAQLSPAEPDAAFRIALPYVAYTERELTTLIVQNQSVSNVNLEIQIRAANGQVVSSILQLLPAYGWKPFDLRIFNGVSKGFVGYALVTASAKVGAWADLYPLVTQQPLSGLRIFGQSIGFLNQPVPLAAQVAPLSATLPITYRWQATDLPQQVTTVAATESSALFLWSAPGIKQVAVTASNVFTSVTASHIVFVAASSVTVPASQSATLVYTDTLYPTTTVQVPADAINQAMRLSYVPVEGEVAPPTGLVFANHHFELVLEFMSEAVFAAQTNVTFDRPLQVTIGYRDINVANASEAGLRLLNWTGSQWRPAGSACVVSAEPIVDPVNNTLTLSICETGRYALFAPPPMVYLPLVVRGE